MRGRKQTCMQPDEKVGAWTLLTYKPGHGKGPGRTKARWICKCECGVIRSVLADNLASGQSKGCGHDSYGGRGRTNYRPVNSVFDMARSDNGSRKAA